MQLVAHTEVADRGRDGAGNGVHAGVRDSISRSPHRRGRLPYRACLVLSQREPPGRLDFEFSYGPLQLYPQYLLWLALRPFGASVALAYYVYYALATVVGLWLLAFVVNRLRLSRRLKSAMFATVALVEIVNPGLGVDYSSLRFVTHLALLVAVLSYARRARSFAATSAAALGALVLALAISPEIGVALLIGLLAAFGSIAVRGDREYWYPIGSLSVGALGLAILVSGQPTFVAFAGGAYYFPVLPGPPAGACSGIGILAAHGVGRWLATALYRYACCGPGAGRLVCSDTRARRGRPGTS